MVHKVVCIHSVEAEDALLPMDKKENEMHRKLIEEIASGVNETSESNVENTERNVAKGGTRPQARLPEYRLQLASPATGQRGSFQAPALYELTVQMPTANSAADCTLDASEVATPPLPVTSLHTSANCSSSLGILNGWASKLSRSAQMVPYHLLQIFYAKV